jgi:hypothetical protein
MLSYKNIAPFLSPGQNRLSRILSYVGLGVGVLLLLCSIQMYVNINHLLKDKNPKKDGYDYISVTKIITNENMAEEHSFSPEEVEELKKQPTIEAATPPAAAHFPLPPICFLNHLTTVLLTPSPKGFPGKKGRM